jgi:hypothetical protein
VNEIPRRGYLPRECFTERPRPEPEMLAAVMVAGSRGERALATISQPFRWLGQDEDGSWFAHEQLPVPAAAGFESRAQVKFIARGERNVNWRDTLTDLLVF